MTIEQLKSKIKKIDDKPLAKAILEDLEKNPEKYKKYLAMSEPIGEILDDWA